MKYFICDELNNTGLVKSFYTIKGKERWRIFKHDEKREDIIHYESVASEFSINISQMVRVPQCHTNVIRVIKDIDAGEGVIKKEVDYDCDGAITNVKNIMLLTIEADCTPVYILDKKNKAIGMVHSGWRGTAKNIAINAINLMKENYNTKNEDLLIYFGPSICGNCYEVSNDLLDEFKKIFNDNEINRVFRKKENCIDKYLLDVALSIKISLLKYGISEKNIFSSKFCTFHDNIFCSWRRDNDKTSHMLTGIMLI